MGLLDFKVSRKSVNAEGDGLRKVNALTDNQDYGSESELPSLRMCYLADDFEEFINSEEPTQDITELFSERVMNSK